MIWKILHTILVTALIALAAAPSLASAQGDDQALVKAFLAARGAHDYVLRPITDDYVARTFSGYSFFAVIFRQWPVPSPPPKDLAFSNVFLVYQSEVTPLTDPDSLKTFFLDTLAAVGTDAEAAKDAGRTWLRLSQEFSQDLFFTFSEPEVEFSDNQGSTVTGRVLVLSGGRGQIKAVLRFDADGVLVDVQEVRKVRAGVRPICQATKLLDRDPLVRRMAEQDLLVMGRAAQDYLDGQRAKARPARQRAIDRIWQRIVAEER